MGFFRAEASLCRGIDRNYANQVPINEFLYGKTGELTSRSRSFLRRQGAIQARSTSGDRRRPFRSQCDRSLPGLVLYPR